MPRPVKCRLIESEPNVALFKPRGIPTALLEDINLTLEEFEAIRLKDLEGLNQAAAATKMGISRPTFQRVLRSARIKISDALVNGKAIRIEGGNYSVSGGLLRCKGCGYEWHSKHIGACPRCSCQGTVGYAPMYHGHAETQRRHEGREKH